VETLVVGFQKEFILGSLTTLCRENEQFLGPGKELRKPHQITCDTQVAFKKNFAVTNAAQQRKFRNLLSQE
jgi:hypothetical protein